MAIQSMIAKNATYFSQVWRICELTYKEHIVTKNRNLYSLYGLDHRGSYFYKYSESTDALNLRQPSQFGV